MKWSQLAGGQSPHTTVLSCADSRVPVERIFAQDIGDVFVVRVAGNVADDLEIASIEYSVAVLGVQQLLVLGHTACGAVAATVDYVASGNSPGSDALLSLVKKIRPAVDAVQQRSSDLARDALLKESILENVRQTQNHLEQASPIIKQAIADKKLVMRGGLYDLGEGTVTYFD